MFHNACACFIKEEKAGLCVVSVPEETFYTHCVFESLLTHKLEIGLKEKTEGELKRFSPAMPQTIEAAGLYFDNLKPEVIVPLFLCTSVSPL